MAVGTLVLLRHGQSDWNAKNLFTGWVDVDLSDKGRAEARRGGELLRESDLLPTVLHTSLLRRAIRTARSPSTPPTCCGCRSVARGGSTTALRRVAGQDKAAIRAEYGDDQFAVWRRSYDVPPPPLPDDDEWSQVATRATSRTSSRAPSA